MTVFDDQTGRLPPQALLNRRYLITNLAGRGGMGAVYHAFDTQTVNRPVAVKELSQNHLGPSEREDATRRFLQEAQLLGSLNHPNLPHIYEAFSENGRYYLVMDFIEGQSLLELLKKNGGRPLAVTHMLSYGIQLCDVLHYLHQQQPPIIFRDLKPSNVMITNQGHVYLIDFGIARIFKEGQTQDTILLGSPGFASPEQHGMAQTNPRSDLYSLGATLHCCLTGKDPFHSKERFSFIPMRQVNPQVPPELDRLVQSLLNINEQQRPPSASAVRQELTRIYQQALEATTALAPSANSSAASDPTQFMAPAPPVPTVAMAPRKAPQPATSPVQPVNVPTMAAGPQSTRPHIAVPSNPQVPPQVRQPGQVWSGGFTSRFLFTLLVTLIGSGIALAGLLLPKGPNGVLFGLAFAIECALSLLLLALCLGSHHRDATSPLPLISQLLMGLGALLSVGASLGLASADLHLWLSNLLSMNPGSISQTLALLLTGGLIIAAGATLLASAYLGAFRERMIVILLGAIALLMVLWQGISNPTEAEIGRHLPLLIALAALILGKLLVNRLQQIKA